MGTEVPQRSPGGRALPLEAEAFLLNIIMVVLADLAMMFRLQRNCVGLIISHVLPCVIVIMHARITSGITSRYAMHCVRSTLREVVLINLVFDNHILHAGLSYFKTLQNHKDTASV